MPQLGQIFRLKRGSVRCSHQALKDGALSIEASTRTADGVVVELYVSGTIEKPLIRLRGNPPRSAKRHRRAAARRQRQRHREHEWAPRRGAPRQCDGTGDESIASWLGACRIQFGAGQTHKGDSVSTVSVRASNTVWFEARAVRSSTQRAQSSGVNRAA